MRLPGQSTARNAFSDPNRLVGRVLATALGTGDLVQSSALVPTGQQPALRPVPVPVAASDLAPLGPGEMTDVLVTVGNDASATTSLVVRGASVLSLSRSSSELVGSSSGGIVTLGVPTLAEVEAIVHAEHTGTLTVVVGEPSDGQGLGNAVTGKSPGAGTAVGAQPPSGNG